MKWNVHSVCVREWPYKVAVSRMYGVISEHCVFVIEEPY